MTEVYLALGSNLGARAAHLAFAVDRLGETAAVTGLSSVYETDPVGFADQRPFLNMVVRLETDREPMELLAVARSLEKERGRARHFRNAPRTLDIDVLLFGDRRLAEAELTIPHPRMTERPFVLVPLLEVEPELREPATGRPYRDYLATTSGGEGVRKILPGDALRYG